MSNIRIIRPDDNSVAVDLCVLLFRIVVGLAFILHGYPKILNATNWMGADSAMPGFLQLLAATAEFIGGMLLIVGFLIRPTSLLLAGTMAVAIYMHAIVWGDPFVSKTGGSYELATVYLCITIMLTVIGGGKFSVDNFISPSD